jgi:hypothetical protein
VKTAALQLLLQLLLLLLLLLNWQCRCDYTAAPTSGAPRLLLQLLLLPLALLQLLLLLLLHHASIVSADVYTTPQGSRQCVHVWYSAVLR